MSELKPLSDPLEALSIIESLAVKSFNSDYETWCWCGRTDEQLPHIWNCIRAKKLLQKTRGTWKPWIGKL